MIQNLGVIQARVGSSRLPSKMLLSIGGHKIFEWVISRTLKSKKLDKIILATSNKDEDIPLQKIASSYNVDTFLGSENDVLSRIFNAVNSIKPKNIIRICADNPMIDPFELDRLINFYESDDYDYSFNNTSAMNNRYADGFGAEILSFNTLQSIFLLSKSEEHREHVTKYITDNPHKFKIGVLEAPASLAYPNLSFDIDTKHDLSYLKKLIKGGVNIDSSASDIIEAALKI